MVIARAPGHRATLQIDAAVGPRPMKPKRSEANRPPTKSMIRLARTKPMSTNVKVMSIDLRLRKLRPPPSSSKTTFSARRAASSTPVVP
jgi:hypothetical protein